MDGVVYETMSNVAFSPRRRGPCIRRKAESKYSGISIYAYVKEVLDMICYHSAKRFDIKLLTHAHFCCGLCTVK